LEYSAAWCGVGNSQEILPDSGPCATFFNRLLASARHPDSAGEWSMRPELPPAKRQHIAALLRQAGEAHRRDDPDRCEKLSLQIQDMLPESENSGW
jgi:hypothetical protein